MILFTITIIIFSVTTMLWTSWESVSELVEFSLKGTTCNARSLNLLGENYHHHWPQHQKIEGVASDLLLWISLRQMFIDILLRKLPYHPTTRICNSSCTPNLLNDRKSEPLLLLLHFSNMFNWISLKLLTVFLTSIFPKNVKKNDEGERWSLGLSKRPSQDSRGQNWALKGPLTPEVL